MEKFKKVLNLPSCIGVWRSPVAYTSGGRVVAGSNPVTPTIISFKLLKTNLLWIGFFCPHLDLQNLERKIFINQSI